MKTIRMVLARNAGNPEGHPGDIYELHAPLSDDGHIQVGDGDELLLTFVRSLPGENVQHGQLVKTEGNAWAFSYEAGEEDDETIVGLEAHTLAPGEYLTVLQDGDEEHVYRIEDVSDRHL